MVDREALGRELDRALRERQVVEPLTTRFPGITIEDAYYVSRAMLDQRLKRGEQLIGKKTNQQLAVNNTRRQQSMNLSNSY